MGRAGESEKTAVLAAASGENEPSGTNREQTPKTVGKKRKLSQILNFFDERIVVWGCSLEIQ